MEVYESLYRTRIHKKDAYFGSNAQKESQKPLVCLSICYHNNSKTVYFRNIKFKTYVK